MKQVIAKFRLGARDKSCTKSLTKNNLVMIWRRSCEGKLRQALPEFVEPLTKGMHHGICF